MAVHVRKRAIAAATCTAAENIDRPEVLDSDDGYR